jgi:hypothetical protein
MGTPSSSTKTEEQMLTQSLLANKNKYFLVSEAQ